VTEVRIPPTLRDAVQGQRLVEANGETAGDVLENLAAAYPALGALLFEDGELAPFVNVYVGGEDVRTRDGLDTRVNDETVILLPAMAGG
jgi:molybdopterin synthase sulfur carrier subunit